jgi:hypothetical protein
MCENIEDIAASEYSTIDVLRLCSYNKYYYFFCIVRKKEVLAIYPSLKYRRTVEIERRDTRDTSQREDRQKRLMGDDRIKIK